MSRTCFESLVTKNDGSDPFKLDGSKSDETDADEYESGEFLGSGSPPEVQSSTKKRIIMVLRLAVSRRVLLDRGSGVGMLRDRILLIHLMVLHAGTRPLRY